MHRDEGRLRSSWSRCGRNQLACLAHLNGCVMNSVCQRAKFALRALSCRSQVTSVVDGYNVCIFAYGQTGSGKTHTVRTRRQSQHKQTSITQNHKHRTAHFGRFSPDCPQRRQTARTNSIARACVRASARSHGLRVGHQACAWEGAYLRGCRWRVPRATAA